MMLHSAEAHFSLKAHHTSYLLVAMPSSSLDHNAQDDFCHPAEVI